MDKTPKERIVFDEYSYYGSDGEVLAIDDLMGRDGLTEAEVRGQYTDHDIFEHAMEMRDFDYEEEITALTAFFDGRTSDMSSFENPLGGNHLLVRGTVERWDRPRHGTTTYEDFDDMMYGRNSVFKDCEIGKIWDENGNLFIHGYNHDGAVDVEVRQLTNEGESVYGELSEDESILDPITLVDPYGKAAFPTFQFSGSAFHGAVLRLPRGGICHVPRGHEDRIPDYRGRGGVVCLRPGSPFRCEGTHRWA